MREIKFKVFCKKHNREEIYTLGDLITSGAGSENGEGGIFENWRQYTGLKDKNGKEIYEGDIVEFKDVGEEGYEYKEGFDFDNIAQVVYENGIYTLSNFGESDNSYYGTNCTDAERLEEVLRNGNCKVIGNIYENPELLEEEI